MHAIQKIADIAGIPVDSIVEVYPYGSRVYGTASANSDSDYQLVYRGSYNKDSCQYDSRDKKISVHTHSVESWDRHLQNHKIFALECQFLGKEYWKPSFSLDLSQLRHEISAKTSNSWVKCKKKITVENDYVIGIKSMFHAFRMPMFGIQIATHGSIVDYSEANYLWRDEFKPMLSMRVKWSELNEAYKPAHNALMTEFRQVAAKA